MKKLSYSVLAYRAKRRVVFVKIPRCILAYRINDHIALELKKESNSNKVKVKIK